MSESESQDVSVQNVDSSFTKQSYTKSPTRRISVQQSSMFKQQLQSAGLKQTLALGSPDPNQGKLLSPLMKWFQSKVQSQANSTCGSPNVKGGAWYMSRASS